MQKLKTEIKNINKKEIINMLKKFKEFAMKGNIVDMAIGVIIGGAFGKIVTSFVGDIIMPLLSLITGNLDFSNLFVALDGQTYPTLDAAKEAGAATLNYGLFITAIIDFLIIAFSIFLIITQITRIHDKINKSKEAPSEEAPPTTKECPFCKTQIHIDAVKCPNCTSDLPVSTNSTDSEDSINSTELTE